MALKKSRKYIWLLIVTILLAIFIINGIPMVFKMVYPEKFKEYVYQYSQEYGLDPYLVFSIIKAESNFEPRALSHRNAKGLMQITDKTGDWAARKLDLKGFQPEDLYNPETNIRMGCWYISSLKREFGENEIDLVLAAYNGGSGNVNKWLKDKNLSSSGETLDRIPFKETENYVKKVKGYYSKYKQLYEKSI